MAYQVVLRTMSWRWDRPRRMLWWSATLSDGRTLEVGLPLHVVATAFHAELEAADIRSEIAAQHGTMGAIEIIGAIEIVAPESVDGFLSGIRRAAKRATRPVRRAVQRTTKRLGRTALRAARTARTVVRSKYTGYGLMALSAAMPAVGGPALAAWATANRVDRTAKDAARIARNVVGRQPTTYERARLNQAQAYAQRARQLSQSNDPMSRMLIAGLRSVG